MLHIIDRLVDAVIPAAVAHAQECNRGGVHKDSQCHNGRRRCREWKEVKGRDGRCERRTVREFDEHC